MDNVKDIAVIIVFILVGIGMVYQLFHMGDLIRGLNELATFKRCLEDPAYEKAFLEYHSKLISEDKLSKKKNFEKGNVVDGLLHEIQPTFMKTGVHIYNVAGHSFKVQLDTCSFLQEGIQENYAPFEAKKFDENALFVVKVVGQVATDDIIESVFREKRHSEQEGAMSVFSTREGWLFEQTQPFSEHSNARIRIDKEFKQAQVAVRGTEQQCWFAFNSAVMLCYLLATAQLDTILTHSSCVVKDGKAYLFLGKSGTGKSTHSSLWLKHITGTTLLNDDHPILRVNEQGEVMAYGSPWSGKTPCYKNESAPVDGIVRIKRALQNSIQELSPIQAYASLTTSFSGMTWEKNLADSRHSTIEKVIESISCYTLSCLPDEEAAQVCHAAVTNQEAKEEECRK